VLGIGLGVVAGVVLDRGYDDPLGLDAAMVNQPCQDNQALLVLVTGDNEGDLGSDIASHDGARYLETANSCRTAWRRPGKLPQSYVAYLGPFSRGDACEKQMTGDYRGAHVTMLTQDSPDTVPCACYVAREGIPVLRLGQYMTDQDLVYLHDVQRLLTSLNIRPDEPADDSYDDELAAQVQEFQHDHGHVVTGNMNPDTWRALLKAGCGPT
jgi:hypothetical protein